MPKCVPSFSRLYDYIFEAWKKMIIFILSYISYITCLVMDRSDRQNGNKLQAFFMSNVLINFIIFVFIFQIPNLKYIEMVGHFL